MFYPVHNSNVGPNHTEPESIGNVEIYNVPQKTNSSRQEKTEGWLGTTDDCCKYAMGEFDTIEQAREAIAKEGWTVSVDEDDIDNFNYYAEEGLVEVWTKIEATYEYVDAGIWWDGLCPEEIFSNTTDEEIEELAEVAEEQALKEKVGEGTGVVVEGIEDYMKEHRDRLKEELDD